MSGDPVNNNIFDAKNNLKKVGYFKIDNSKSVSLHLEDIKNSDKNVIFFVQVGAGKTTLTNKLCGTRFEVAKQGLSVTRDLQFADSLDKKFKAIDFPGLGSASEELKHYEIQRTILSTIPVRIIFFVCKLENRDDPYLKMIKNMKGIFDLYVNNTLIIMTHCENILSDFKRKSEIEYLIKNKCGYNKENIIFSHKNYDFELLSKRLSDFKDKVPNFPFLMIKTNYLLQSMGTEVYQEIYREERNKFKNEFNNIIEIFKRKLYENNNDVKSALFFALKLYKSKHLRRFNKAIREKSINDTDENILDYQVCETIMYSNFILDEFNKAIKQ